MSHCTIHEHFLMAVASAASQVPFRTFADNTALYSVPLFASKYSVVDSSL